MINNETLPTPDFLIQCSWPIISWLVYSDLSSLLVLFIISSNNAERKWLYFYYYLSFFFLSLLLHCNAPGSFIKKKKKKLILFSKVWSNGLNHSLVRGWEKMMPKINFDKNLDKNRALCFVVIIVSCQKGMEFLMWHIRSKKQKKKTTGKFWRTLSSSFLALAVVFLCFFFFSPPVVEVQSQD